MYRWFNFTLMIKLDLFHTQNLPEKVMLKIDMYVKLIRFRVTSNLPSSRVKCYEYEVGGLETKGLAI